MDQVKQEQEDAWRVAFETIGEEQVRLQMLVGVYTPELRNVATRWLARQSRERAERDKIAAEQAALAQAKRDRQGRVAMWAAIIAAALAGVGVVVSALHL